MRRVTFSRNYTLSLSRTCQCYCKYCAFATHQAHIHAPDEVEALLDEALKRNAKELLVLTGERPEVNPVVADQLAEWGHEDFTSYVVWACERALERGMLPHTNIGVLDREDLARLREVTASQGLMLESVSERLMETVHAGSPTKHPAQRLATIEAAGELKIPFTSGILVGIGETEDERVESLEALAELHERYGHLQEVILQNFVPHPRYYGAEVADIADEASRERWAGDGDALRTEPPPSCCSGGHPRARESPTEVPRLPCPTGRVRSAIEEIKRLDSGVQAADAGCRGAGAAEPVRWWAELVEAGATDLGGLSANGDHISPEQPFPSPHRGAQGAGAEGVCADRAALRLSAVHGHPEWMEQGVLDVIKLKYWSFIPRQGVRAAERRDDRRGAGARGDREGARGRGAVARTS